MESLKTASVKQWQAIVKEARKVDKNANIPYSFYINGYSMLPIIRSGIDKVTIEYTDTVKKYDIVMLDIPFQNMEYIVHRVVNLSDDYIQTFGDGNISMDPITTKDRVMGKVTHIQRGSWSINPNRPVWRLYAIIWHHLRFMRPVLLTIVKKIGKIRKKQ